VELSFAAAVSALPGFGQVAALGRVGRIAQFLLSNPIVRETVRSEALGAVHSILGTGEAGQVSSLLAGRTSFESAARDYALNGLYGRLSGGVVQNVSNAAQRRFRYGAGIVDGVSGQVQSAFVAAVNTGIDRAIPSPRPR